MVTGFLFFYLCVFNFILQPSQELACCLLAMCSSLIVPMRFVCAMAQEATNQVWSAIWQPSVFPDNILTRTPFPRMPLVGEGGDASTGNRYGACGGERVERRQLGHPQRGARLGNQRAASKDPPQ